MTMVMDRETQETVVRRLEADVAEAAGALNAAHGRLVDLTAELIETEAWRGFGIKSVEHWLVWRAGVSPHRARQVAAIARRRCELPVTCDTLTRGELSVDQVSEVAKFVPAHNDAEGASFAKVATVPQLRNTLSRYRFANDAAEPDPSAAEPAEAVRKGSATFFHDGNRFGMHVDAPLDDGALIEKALAEAKDALFQAGHPDVAMLDALLEVCGRSLATVESTARQSRFRVYVHLDTDGGWLNQGPALPDVLLSKLCCDGLVQPVWETDGSPVNVGRSQRIVPDRTRRLVLDRDRTCIVPGCGSGYHVEVHHLLPWAQGGPTDTDNLGCLCTFHHDAVHRGELTITGNPDRPETLRFTDAVGRHLPPMVPPVPPRYAAGDPDGNDPPYAEGRPSQRPRYRHPPGERLDRRFVHFTPASWSERTATARANAPPA